ncbi:hypothetical protein RHHCN13_07120 [Rickettsia conorii subsp. heilongjiangensis]|uniref:Uncharacterized protein n=2 Tax=spotted fever group TaxID=114277 RepID=A0ABM6YES0_RICJA|nr:MULTISPECIES: hypothetical protein [spotted fever group]AXU06028.1 hypothetical protein D0Z68_00245 [Rickettsia japonica]QHE24709.1 hypothetical protein GRX81_02670 [Rickettsia japonica]BBM90871.1 hypothetical protein RHCH81_07120 [Rickettsia conorii subsp. heilongjiangensis]BBM92080.1 hypothetical protein RHHCN13_07120 [Rickettsia conorii subsp. heilongjiangensis]BBM93289.1 hypothetical protein RHSENDAI29_07120 [Rickettsia conorii subsp. heilongjiangensis]
MGKLTHSTLQIYTKEYYHHVTAFPRYITNVVIYKLGKYYLVIL